MKDFLYKLFLRSKFYDFRNFCVLSGGLLYAKMFH